MDTDIFMAVVAGFLGGIAFTILLTNIITWRVAAILDKAFGKKLKKRKKELEEMDDEPANYWKPKGWKPDGPD